jgi:hypothetical protein
VEINVNKLLSHIDVVQTFKGNERGKLECRYRIDMMKQERTERRGKLKGRKLWYFSLGCDLQESFRKLEAMRIFREQIVPKNVVHDGRVTV